MTNLILTVWGTFKLALPNHDHNTYFILSYTLYIRLPHLLTSKRKKGERKKEKREYINNEWPSYPPPPHSKKSYTKLRPTPSNPPKKIYLGIPNKEKDTQEKRGYTCTRKRKLNLKTHSLCFIIIYQHSWPTTATA